MTTIEVQAGTPLDAYVPLLGRAEIEEIRTLARPLRGRTIQMINSTSVGGGVAEILNRLVPLALELDLQITWDVMAGGPDFFEVTKAFHNALHGGAYLHRPEDFEIFARYTEQNRARLPLDADFTVIHDPQPAALVEGRERQALDLAVSHRSLARQRERLELSGAVRHEI